MKLKTILGIAAAACATLVMSVAACAATDVKPGTITKAGNYIVVPVEITSTDLDNFGAYTIQVKYDTGKFTPVRVVDTLTYVDPIFGETTNFGSLSANVNYDPGVVQFNWFVNNGDAVYPQPNEGTIKLANVYFSTSETEYSSKDFPLVIVTLCDKDEVDFEVKSYFTFDVTGDLGGKEVVALGASTDGGITIQPLNYYSTTNWTEGMDYADATTTFVVSVENTRGLVDFTDVTIYGELADGAYIPLSAHDQSKFLVQTFK